MKGGASNIGAVLVTKLAGELERLAGLGDVSAVRAGISGLDAAVDAFAATANDWKAEVAA